ncbi:hypothetical protein GGI07_005691 [Coemansia sp. Benny D115]|nr:hypothetical protein GGI07_005691 [Coemansia sp. Benny D115]
MSARDLLDILREYGLEHHYPFDGSPYERDHHSSAYHFENQRKRTEYAGFAESDEDGGYARGQGAGNDRAGGIPRPGGGQPRVAGRKPPGINTSANGSGYGAARSGIPMSSMSSPPPMSANHSFSGHNINETRTIGRHGLPVTGNQGPSALNRRQTLVPSASNGFGFARGNEGPALHGSGGAADRGGMGGMAAHRSRSVARPTTSSARTSRAPGSSVNDILERSNNYSQAQRLAENPDDDLEHVVRKTGQSGLVNAYGIPTRPTTAHTRRPGNDRRSLAPSSNAGPLLRPQTAQRGARPDGGSGGSALDDTPSNLNDKIRVCVRKRPLNRREKEKGDRDIVNVKGCRSLSVMEPKTKVDLTKYIEESRFTFDEVFDEHSNNTDVYRRTAKPLVDYIFTGGNATCFAYGQTGSGKTYTMMDVQNGLYIQAAVDIFSLLERPENQNLQVFVMFYEIYMSNLYDLLNGRQKLHAREDANQNVCIQGVREVLIQSPSDLLRVFEFGNGCRSTGSTGANSDSSRSHAILQISLKDTTLRKPVTKGKLSFIDLAGNERGADRGDSANKQTLMEGSEINKSLLALKECIRALDLNKKHQPFRQSKLTQVLKDSFIGNARACMIATISPNTPNSEHTLNTLRYSDRVKTIRPNNSGGDGRQQASDYARDAEEYPMDDIEEDYEDDSAVRAYDDYTDNSYSASGTDTKYISSSHDAFREEDEYAEDSAMDAEDEFASVSSSYYHSRKKHMQQQQQNQYASKYERDHHRPSFEERLDLELAEGEQSIADEQPSFIDDARQSLRSPREYGSPAAKSYVASRMAKSPSAGQTHGLLSKASGASIRPKRSMADAQAQSQAQSQQVQPRSSFEDDGSSNGRYVSNNSTANVRRIAGTNGGMSSAHGMRPPNMPRGNSISNGSGMSLDSSKTAASLASPHASAVSMPSDESAPPSGRSKVGGTASNRSSYYAASDDAVMVDSAEGGGGNASEAFGGIRIADVDALVNQHRLEIRATTEACKVETMLVASYAAFTYANLVQQSRNRADGGRSRPNSWQQQPTPQSLADKYHLDIDSGVVTRLADGERFDSVDKAKMHEAVEYLEKLDEVLAKKQQQVIDLRERIRNIVWNATEPAN